MQSTDVPPEKLTADGSNARTALVPNMDQRNVNWESMSLGSLCKSAIDGPFGSKLKTEHYSTCGVRVVRLQNIGIGDFIDTDKAFISHEYFEDLKGYEIAEDDLLVASMGDERLPAGRCVLAPDAIRPAIIKADCFRLRLDATKIDGRYLSVYLNSPLARTAIEKGSHGQTRLRLNLANTKRLPIPTPPLETQGRIADIIFAFNHVIDGTRTVIDQTRTLKTVLMDDLFTNGLPGRHQSFVTTPPIGRIPADWRVVRLDDIATVERGKFTHRPRNDARFYGGNIPFVQTSDVVNSGDYLRAYSQTLNELGLSVSRRFPPNTILFVIAGSVGETTIASYEVAFPDSVVGITPHEGIDPLFLLRVLQHARPRILRSATESAQANISLELLQPLPFPLPGDAERDAIMQTLRAVESRIERESARLEQLNGTKAALSQALLTGRVPLPKKGNE